MLYGTDLFAEVDVDHIRTDWDALSWDDDKLREVAKDPINDIDEISILENFDLLYSYLRSNQEVF